MPRSPSILIFGINYAPEPIGIAVNTTWLAESLAERGWDVAVATGVPHYPWWEARPSPPLKGPPRVRRYAHYVPRSQSVARRGAYELTWLASASRALAGSRRLDLVLGVTPSLSGAALARAAAARYRVPYALLVSDVVGRAARQTAIAGARRVADRIERIELSLARGAHAVGVISEGFRTYFREGGVDPARIFRVRNPARLAPATEAREQTRRRLGWDGEFVVLHSGNMGYKQHLENVVRATAMASGCGIRFVLQGDGSQRETLERLAAASGCSNLDIVPLASSNDFPNVLRAADALLVNQAASVRNMSLPGKLDVYLLAGRPIIAAVDAADEVARELGGARAGIVVRPEQPGELVAAAKRLRSDPALALDLGARGRSFAESELTPERALDTFAPMLQRALAGGRPAATVSRWGGEAR